ncbi:MAG: hypothetical protein IJF17_05040 [Thermoguttaceae bacterium]|nr:hypothetical protein [Thermoguttaceae bacterium]
MKKIIFIFAIILFWGTETFAQEGEMRTWTDIEGHQIKGVYSGLSSGHDFIRLSVNGKARRWRLENFSDADLVYIGRQGSEERKAVITVRPHLSSVLPSSQTSSSDSDEDETTASDEKVIQFIQAQGIGETPEKARKDALSNAIQEAAGTFVNTQTLVEDEEVFQQILTYSGAYVENSKVISTVQEDGLYTVTILAKIKKTVAKEKNNSESSQLIPFNGSALADKLDTQFNSARDGVIYLANFLREENFPYSCLKSCLSKPITENNGFNISLTYYWGVSADTFQYSRLIQKLLPLLEKMGTSKITYTMEKQTNGRWAPRFVNGVPAQDPNETYLDVCVSSSDLQRSMIFYRYQLPRQYSTLLSYCRKIIPVIEIRLLDENKRTIAVKRDFIVHNYEQPYEYAVFNMMYSLADYRDFPAVPNGSTLLPACQITPFCISPCLRFPHKGERLLNLLIGKTTFFLSRETASSVKYYSSRIIFENKKMESIYQKMDALLELQKIY